MAKIVNENLASKEYKEGHEAKSMNKLRKDNPYPSHGFKHKEWDKGWYFYK